jgi:hypothetical protein
MIRVSEGTLSEPLLAKVAAASGRAAHSTVKAMSDETNERTTPLK